MSKKKRKKKAKRSKWKQSSDNKQKDGKIWILMAEFSFYGTQRKVLWSRITNAYET